MNKFNLQQKAEQIQCPRHMLPIVQLNISQNIPMGNRLICRKCKTLGQASLFTETIEEYLIEWLDEESKQCQNVDKQLEEILSLLEREKHFFEKLLEVYIQEMKKKFQSIFQQQKEIITKKVNLFKENSQIPQIQSIFEQISRDYLSDTILQQLALFLSDQTIENGQIKLKRKIDVSELKQTIIKPLIAKVANQFYELNSILSSKVNYEHSNLGKELEKLNQILITHQNEFQLIQSDGHNTRICSIVISHDDQMIASGDKDGRIILWRISNQQKIQNYKTQCSICDLTFSQDDKLLVACQFDQPYEVLIFEVMNSKITSPAHRLNGHISTINRAIFTLDSNYLISGSQDKILKIWDFKKQSVLFESEYPAAVNGLSMSQNTKYFSICCGNGQAYLFNYQSKPPQLNQIIKWQAHQGAALGTIFTPNSEQVLTSFQEIKFWSVKNLLLPNWANQNPLKTIQGDYLMWNLQICSTKQLLISNDGKIKIWKLASGELINEIDVQGGNKYAIVNNISRMKKILESPLTLNTS